MESDGAPTFIHKFSVFADIKNEQLLKKVCEKLQKKEYKEGEVLVKEGDIQTSMFLLDKGVINRMREGIKVDELREGGISGMLHLIEDSPVFATLVCKEDVTVYVMEGKDFKELFDISRDEKLHSYLLCYLSRELRSQTKIVRSLKKTDSGKFRIAFFDVKVYERIPLEEANKKAGSLFALSFFEERLDLAHAALAVDHNAVCVFVNDDVSGDVVNKLAELGVKLILLRATGYNNIDLKTCDEHGITVARVPEYSPYAVAEHAAGLMLTLNRHIHKAFNRTREGNFSLNGLCGFDMHGKTVGILGTGRIGRCLLNIMLGFGCNVLCFDKYPSEQVKAMAASGAKVKYVEFDQLLEESDIISLHLPLTSSTKHSIDEKAFAKMKKGVMIINTSRGGLIKSSALIGALKSNKVGAAGLDVVEEEGEYVFQDHSLLPIANDVLTRLISFPNVLLTGHQAFFTNEAVSAIVSTTIANARSFFIEGKHGRDHPNVVVAEY